MQTDPIMPSRRHSDLSSKNTVASAPAGGCRIGPITTLLLLAPIISEVLYGGTRVSAIFVVIPEVMTWGCGALLIRYWARRWNKGWTSVLVLGLALAVAEECIIQQTSIAPLVGLGQLAYGRVLGVNWVYLLWALGYESVWVVLIPVQFTELLFPARRGQLWLGLRGVIAATAVFALGSVMAWFSWTQMARVKVFHMQPYSPPALYIMVALAVIGLLVLAAHRIPTAPVRSGQHRLRPSPPPWLVGVNICILGSPWAALAVFGFGAFPTIPFALLLSAGLAWAGLAFSLIQRWSSSAGWSDAHRYALVFGGVMACMLGGFVVFKVGGAVRIDWIGKIVLNIAALTWLVAFGRRALRSREI
jgi:hypothetical protein